MKYFKTAKGTELPIMDIKGKDYLQVAQRLVWFREEKPEWTIETDIRFMDVLGPDTCMALAIIRNDGNKVMATAHKVESAKGFADYVEKAETGAIGRALAMCGYGTQFAADELDEGQRLADAPTVRPQKPLPKVAAINKPVTEEEFL